LALPSKLSESLPELKPFIQYFGQIGEMRISNVRRY